MENNANINHHDVDTADVRENSPEDSNIAANVENDSYTVTPVNNNYSDNIHHTENIIFTDERSGAASSIAAQHGSADNNNDEDIEHHRPALNASRYVMESFMSDDSLKRLESIRLGIPTATAIQGEGQEIDLSTP